MENQILIALKNNKLLKNILFTELNLSDIKGNLLTLSEGEILYREGDKSEFLYLIVGGEMNVIRKKGSRRTLSEIFSDHDFFGSDEFIEASDRKSTAVALRDSYIIALSKNEVDSLIEQNDEILTNLYESLHQEEAETEIETPDLDKVDFKKAGKQESSFADRVKKQKESAENADELEPGETPENIGELGEKITEKSDSDQSVKKDDEEPFINAYSENMRSFSTIEPKKEPETKKSFKDKIESGAEKESAPAEEQLNGVTEEPVPEEEISPNVEEPDLSESKSELLKEDDRFPTTFDISFSYSDENKNSENDKPVDSTSDTVEPESTLQETDTTALDSLEERPLNEFDIAGDNATDLPGDASLENLDETADPPQDVPELQNENTFPVPDEPAKETLPEKDALSGTQDLEDFYASISESPADSNASTQTNSDILSGFDSDDKTSDSVEDFNPFPELENEPNQGDEEYPNEFTTGDEYKPDDEAELSSFEEDVQSDLNADTFIPDTGDSLDEETASSDEPEEFLVPDAIADEEPAHSEFSEILPEPEVPVEETSSESNVSPRDYQEVDQSIDMLDKINKAAQVVNSNIQIDDVFKGIVDVATDLTSADRGTLYLVDKKKHELWSKVAIGNEFKEIKLAMGEGIAGWVAQHGEIINLENVKDDPRFNASFDKTSGYETKTMICFPIRNKNEEIVGVLQLINSRNGKFSKLDEEFLEALSIHVAMALQNAELVEQLLTGERVSSLGKMANFLLQDIKKPIMVSKRYAEHLKSKMLDEDVSRVVDMLLDQLNHIADLVQSTSSYSEGQIVLRSMLCKLNETLDDYTSRVDAILRASNCQIAKEYDNEINVKISPKQMYQCFQHLIKNACDAMPDGGTIYLSTKIDKDSVHIVVKDNGLGIPDSLHDKIFEPFMSHGKKEGTGLGLSITKKIIEEHGGTISVQSEMGEGATFTISLPIVYDM